MKEDHIKNWTNHSQALSGWHLVCPTELAFHWAPSKQGSNINDITLLNSFALTLRPRTQGWDRGHRSLG